MKYILTFVTACLLYPSTAQSIERSPDQSVIYDAIEVYYASHGITYYFRQIADKPGSPLNIEVIDLYHQQRVGNLDDLVPNTFTDPNEKIAWFLRKFNDRKEPVTMVDIATTTTDTATAYNEADVKTKSKAILAAIKSRYPNNAFNGGTNAFLDSLSLNRLPFFQWNWKQAVNFFKAYTSGDITLKAKGTDVGGGFAQNLGEGLADFLIERANEELQAAVFRRLIKAFQENAELPILFPSIYEFLQNVEQYNFDLAIKTIQARAEKDLNNLLINIPKLSGLEKYQKLINQHPGTVYVLAAMTTLSGISDKLEASKIIDSVYLAPYTALRNDHANALKFAGFISQSLRNNLLVGTPKDQSKDWVLINNVWYGLLGTNTITRNYLRLLILKDPGIGFNWPETPADAPPRIKPFQALNGALPRIQARAADLLQIVSSLDKIVKGQATVSSKTPGIPATKTELPKRSDIHSLLDNVFAITESGLAFIPDGVLSNKAQLIGFVHTAQESLPILDRVVEISEQIKLKNYNEVIFNSGLLVKALLDLTGKSIPEEYFQYGNFLASVAIAKNGADVKAAIDAVALPSGSSSIKKDLVFNSAINGYVGYFYRDLGKDDRYYDGFTETHGITAPVGVTISHGMGTGGSISLFLGILDVGAIVKYKVTDNPDETPSPTIEWGNILSPSVHAIYGFPGYLPFSIGIGSQWLPKKMEDDHLKFSGGFNIFIAFDIPMINVASSKKRSTYATHGR